MASRDPLQQIIEALRLYLKELRTHIIVISDPERNYYVQAAGHDDGDRIVLWCEAVSDENLSEWNSLGADGAARLRRLGWNDPDPNWSREMNVRSVQDLEAVAEVLLDTLREVYRFEDGLLEIEMGDPSGVVALESPALQALLESL